MRETNLWVTKILKKNYVSPIQHSIKCSLQEVIYINIELYFLDIAYPATAFSEEGSHMGDSSDFMLVFFVERSNTPSPIIIAREKTL